MKMRKLLSLLLTAALSAGICSAFSLSASAVSGNGTISNCFSMTQLTVGGMYESSSVGGFVGMNNGVIENCLYTGHIYC